MKQTVYLETTIPSYLTAWRSNELIMAANQQATREWWDLAKPNFEVFISEVVIKEAAEGNAEAAERRLASTKGIPELALSAEAEQLASLLLAKAALPAKARIDALHIAIATLNGMDFCSLGTVGILPMRQLSTLSKRLVGLLAMSHQSSVPHLS